MRVPAPTWHVDTGGMNPGPAGRSQEIILNFLRIYQLLGLDVVLVRNTPRSGICTVQERMSSSRLKVS
jgi:hypothetical protein